LFFGFIKPIGYFKGKGHRDLNVPEHMSSSSRFLMFTDLENGLTITENRVNFFNDFGKSSALKEQDI
jgi:hypothetical protein